MIDKKELDGFLILNLPERIGVGFSSEDFKNLKDILEKTEKKIILDMSKTKSIDSSAIGLFIKKVKNTNPKSLVMIDLRTKVKELLKIANLHEIIKMFRTYEQAKEFLLQD